MYFLNILNIVILLTYEIIVKVHQSAHIQLLMRSNNLLKMCKRIKSFLDNEIESLGFQTNLHDMSSPWVGMNFLSVKLHLS